MGAVVQAQLRALFDTAVAAADPARALPPYLAQIADPRPKGRLVVLGAGKAAAAMAAAVRGQGWRPRSACWTWRTALAPMIWRWC